MSLLHCFYGVGVSLSPFLMALALGHANNWREGYRVVFLVMVAISLIALLSLPLWNKVKTKQPEEERFTPKTLSLMQMVKSPAVVISWVLFFSSVGLEFTCGIWACTYLVNTQAITEATASNYLTFYYAGITISRFISGFYSKKFAPNKSVYFGYSVVGVALLMLFLPLPIYFKAVSLFLIGFGNGPTFPNIIFVTPSNFGKEVSQSIIGSQMAFCNIGILIMPPIFGFMAQWLGLQIFPIYLTCLFVIMVLSTIIYNRITANGKAQINF
jgi:fucose permease